MYKAFTLALTRICLWRRVRSPRIRASRGAMPLNRLSPLKFPGYHEFYRRY